MVNNKYEGMMNRVIDLITQKNHFLEKFYSVNETGLAQFIAGDFSGLDKFYADRESILDTIKYIDSEIDRCETNSLVFTDEIKREIRQHLQIKEEYVSRILTQDLEVLSCIENEKSNIIRELQDLKRTKKAVGSYKSSTFTNRLNEEA